MEMSLLIAKLIGLPVLVAGAGLLLNPAGYREMAKEFLKSEGLIYMSGVLILVAGLAIIIAHNRWAWDWTVIITLFGWLSAIGGAVRMTYPKWVARVGGRFIENPAFMRAGAVFWLAAGGALTYFGFAG